MQPITSGSPTANFYIIGEALGADEERIGRPFVGASGHELYLMLEEARWLPPGTARTINDAIWRNNLLPLDKALEANDIFICNVTSDRPPSNDINKFFVTKTAAKRSGVGELNGRFPLQPIIDGLRDLTAYFEQYRPDFILCLGGTALWALTGFTGITKWRGSILPVEQGPVGSIVGRSGQPTKLIPTFHPADILHEWPHRAIAVQDMRRAYRERQFPEIRRPTYHFIIRPSYSECMDWLEHHSSEPSLRDIPLVGDIETPHGWRNLPGHIACIGFADSRTSAICIPLMCVDDLEGYWTPDKEASIILALRRLMTSRPMIWHNGAFDIMHIIRHWGFQPNWSHDTMLMQHVAFPGLLGGKIDPVTLKVSKKGSSLSLLFCASMYCDYFRSWKSDGKDWNQKEIPDEDGWWKYNQEDCVRTYEVFEALTALLYKFSLWEAYTFMMSLGQPVMDMMLHGLPVDIARRDEFTKTVRSEQKMLQKWIDGVCGHPLNTGSTGPTGQMQKLFYEDMAIPIVYKGRGKERRPSLDKTALETISKKIPLLAPLCDTITAERSLAHFDEGILSDNLDEDCYMRTTVNLTGTETMRFSSTETVYGRGINGQNINRMPEKELDDDDDNDKIHLIGDPPPVRRLFRPSSPQMLLFEVDLERADPQVCAKESGDEDLLTAFREKHDIYSEMGRWVYNQPAISKEQRQWNKNAINGVDYGCKANTLATTLHVNRARASDYLDRWFTLHPGIAEWHRNTDDRLYKTRTVHNIWGFRRYYTDRLDSLLPQALAWICSSTVSITINKAMRRIYDELPEVRLFLQIHDSILGEVPLARAEYLLPRVVECCRIEIPYKPDPLVIPGSLKVSTKSWGDVEPWSIGSNYVWRTVVNEQLEKFGIEAIAKGDAPPWEG